MTRRRHPNPPAEGTGLNTLTDDERWALARSAMPLCRRMGADAARDAGRKRETADFVSAAYVAACQAAQQWEPVGSGRFTTYAAAWVRNALYAARARLDPATLIDAWDEVGGTGRTDPGPGPTPLDGSPLTRLHYRLLGRLREPTRTAVELCVFEGLPADRAAARMGRAVKDVKLMLRNAAGVARLVACEGGPAGEVPPDWARRYCDPAAGATASN